MLNLTFSHSRVKPSDPEFPALKARWTRRFLFLEKEYLAIKDADQLAPIFGKRCARGVYQLPLTLLLQPTP